MTRRQIQAELRAAVQLMARQNNWPPAQTAAALKQALADTAWVLACQQRIRQKRN